MIDKQSCAGSPASSLVNPVLSAPHSVSMVDFDGDCMADLFLTLEEAGDPEKKYTEIYLRREHLAKPNATMPLIPGT